MLCLLRNDLRHFLCCKVLIVALLFRGVIEEFCRAAHITNISLLSARVRACAKKSLRHRQLADEARIGYLRAWRKELSVIK